MEMLDVQALSRLPEEYQAKEIDKINEAIEKEANQNKVYYAGGCARVHVNIRMLVQKQALESALAREPMRLSAHARTC